MDITPFYELKERLYLSAAAGCSAIEEDFRLRRAVDSFKTIAGTNKTYTKLYEMCEKLFSSEDTALLLADCIALADALAVAQGTFSDNTPCVPYDGTNAEPINMRYFELQETYNLLNSRGYFRPEMSLSRSQAYKDPRVMNECLVQNADEDSIFSKEAMSNVILCAGKNIIPILKKQVDTSNPKCNGMSIEYVCDLAGDEENDWYISLAHDENLPRNVRIKAIESLACSYDNVDCLLELYKTERGKIKNAALVSLAKLNPPEAEPIFSRLAKNYKDSYREAFTTSGGKVCTEFAIDWFRHKLLDHSREENEMTLEDMYMLANKTDVADTITLLLKYTNNLIKMNMYKQVDAYDVNKMLVRNLYNHPEEEYRELIRRLFKTNGDLFFSSHYTLSLMEDFDNAITSAWKTKFIYRERVYDILANIFVRPDGKYYLHYTNEADDYYMAYPLFDSIPDNLLELVTDYSCLEITFEDMPGDSTEYEPLYNDRLNETMIKTLTKLLRNCSDADYQRVRNAGLRCAFNTLKVFPNTDSLDFAINNYNGGNANEYRNLLSKCIVDSVRRNQPLPDISFYIHHTPLPPEEIASELKLAIINMKAIQPTISEYRRHQVGRYIAMTEAYVRNMETSK
jgi:hypothetical protein